MNHDIEALFLGPHPDDVEIGCGGTVLRLVAAGQRVAITDLTRGEAGTRGDAATRRAECAAATRALGITERVNLELPDAGLRGDDDTMAGAIVGQIRRLRPRLLFAPHEHDVHPDHTAAARLAQRAFFLAGLARFEPSLGAPYRPAAVLRYPGNDHVEPDFCVDISDFLAAKHAAIECYATQLGTAGGTGATHFVKRLDPLRRCAARDGYFGAQLGCRAAEPFVTGAPLLVTDLSSLFRR